ncbi:MAG TPA: PQ-loop domain-containing transporter [Candidatus Paceibacterota bacterium]|nr:PQ-loop domain-containing transporter [Candidatus Paceibacterota bacterium]
MLFHLGLRHKELRRDVQVSDGSSIPPGANPRYIHLLDRITFIAGVAGPFTVLPQIYQIFTTQVATGLSLSSWILIFIVTFPWIFYGIAHRDRSIITSYILWEIANIIIIVGILLYR